MNIYDPHSPYKARLTGKKRYRSSWRGKLILQVQVKGVETWWRDATVRDLEVFTNALEHYDNQLKKYQEKIEEIGEELDILKGMV